MVSALSRPARQNTASSRVAVFFFLYFCLRSSRVYFWSRRRFNVVLGRPGRACTFFVAKKINSVVRHENQFPVSRNVLDESICANGSKPFSTTVRSTSTYKFATNNISINSRQKQSAIIFVRETRLPFFSETPTSLIDTIRLQFQCVRASTPVVDQISTIKNTVNYFLLVPMSEF